MATIRPSTACVRGIVCAFVLAGVVAAQENVLDDADAAFVAGDFEHAAELYARFVPHNPQAQRPAIRYAVSLFRVGRPWDALDEALRANTIASYEPAHAAGLLCVARTCYSVNCADDAREALTGLSELYPNTPEAVEAAAIAALLQGEDASSLLARWDLEQLARSELRQIVGDLDQLAHPQQIRAAVQTLIARAGANNTLNALNRLIDAYPDTNSARQALRFQLAIQAQQSGGLDHAVTGLEQLFAECSAAAPHSLFTRQIGHSLAYLYLRQGNAQQAVSQYAAVAALARSSAEEADALLDAAFDVFESAGARVPEQEPIATDELFTIQQLCRRARDHADASAWNVAQSRRVLIFAEYLSGDGGDVVSQAETFCKDYTRADWLSLHDRAQVRLMLGELLLARGDCAAALPHFRWITDNYERGIDVLLPEAPQPFAGCLLTVSRAYYKTFLAHLVGDLGSNAELISAGQAVLDEFPNSRHAALVRTILHDRLGD